MNGTRARRRFVDSAAALVRHRRPARRPGAADVSFTGTDVSATGLYRYHRRTLLADHARALAGLTVCALPLLALDVAFAVACVLAAVAAVFAAFGLRTWQRQLTAVELSPQGIATRGPLARRIAWRELSAMRLAFYSMRRRRSSPAGPEDAVRRGWMELKLAGPGGRIAVDSSLQGFDAVVAAAFAAARARELPLSAVTRANLDAMGLAPDDGGAPEGGS